MPNDGRFNIRSDIEIEKSGGFLCQGCLMGKPTSEVGPDPRYCQGCYDFLLAEAEADDTTRRGGSWKPVRPIARAKIGHERFAQISADMRRNMATVRDKKSEVAIIPPQTLEVAIKRRGPKQRDLPQDIIEKWRRDGLGSKRIAARLEAEYGIEVGFRTIARILSGQRVFINV